MYKIYINGIVRNMTEEEIAAYNQSDMCAPYSDSQLSEQNMEELKLLLSEITAKIPAISDK